MPLPLDPLLYFCAESVSKVTIRTQRAPSASPSSLARLFHLPFRLSLAALPSRRDGGEEKLAAEQGRAQKRLKQN